jgi:hypothetical protein
VHWDQVINQAIGLLAIAVGGWLGRRIITPTDAQRAAHLDKIASGAASLAVSMFPNQPWAILLENTVKQIAAAAGVPTANRDAIQRAAAAALTALGKAPNGK